MPLLAQAGGWDAADVRQKLRNDLEQTDVEVLQGVGGDSRSLQDESQQDVLGADVLVLAAHRLTGVRVTLQPFAPVCPSAGVRGRRAIPYNKRQPFRHIPFPEASPMRAIFGFTLLATLAVPLAADDVEPKQAKLTKEQLEKAEAAVKKHLEDTGAKDGKLVRLSDDAVENALAGFAVYSVTFRQFPVARATPKGYNAANVIAVNKDNKPGVINTQKDLQKFFQTNLAAATSEAKLKDAVRAYLLVAKELRQDGFFTFELENDSTKVEGKDEKTARGKVVVAKGGNGTLEAKLSFDKSGKLVSIDETDKIRAGVRPICQATKLLDKDPIVRAMAEQALLVMGRAAKDYLDEQKAKAGDELKREIDRVWKKIVEEDK